MGNVGTAIVKIVLAAGGAVLGVLLARWGDEYMASRFQEKPETDKTRYEQGLVAQVPVQGVQPPIVVMQDDYPYQEEREDQKHK